MMESKRPKDQFYGKYNVFDGNYFYESYYLLRKFDERVVEFSVDDYFENNQQVDLNKFKAKLAANGFGDVVVYRHNTIFNKKEERYSIDWYLIFDEERIIMNINHDTVKSLHEIYFHPHQIISIESVPTENLERVFRIAQDCLVETEDDKRRYINIVSSMPREGLRLNKYEIKRPKIQDLDLYYGWGFQEKHKRFVNQIHQKEKSGLFIFHGLTGSGKTNYIRYLISQTRRDTNFIFYPITLLRELADPQLITFISDYQHSVLIIEESEDTVQARDNFNSDRASIANLLNISDGLLSDVLNLKIISTFNTDIKNLDRALLREGRLLGIHKFDKISVESANRIAMINNIDKEFTEPVTLAQIFNNPLKEDFSDFVLDNSRIGF